MNIAPEGVAFFWLVAAAVMLWKLAEWIGETLDRWAWEDALRARMAEVRVQMDAIWPWGAQALVPFRQPILRPPGPLVIRLEIVPTPYDWAEEDQDLR